MRRSLPSLKATLSLLFLVVHCGGRMIDDARPGDADGGSGSGSGSSSTGPTSSSTTLSSSSTSSVAVSTSTTGLTGPVGPTTSVTTGYGGYYPGSGGYGGYAGYYPGSGGYAGYAGRSSTGGGLGTGGAPWAAKPDDTVVCQSAPIPNSPQQIYCKKLVRDPSWQCTCQLSGVSRQCFALTVAMPCGEQNCCGFDTRAAVGCPATPVTIATYPYCQTGGRPLCSHVTQINSPDYGPFTSCCPRETPYSCPNGTPNACFRTAEEARKSCGDYCVQCQ